MFGLGKFKIKNIATGDCVHFMNFECTPHTGGPAIGGYTIEFVTDDMGVMNKWLNNGNDSFDGELIQIFDDGREECALELKGIFVSSITDNGDISIFCMWIVFNELSETGGVMRNTYREIVRQSLRNFNEQLGADIFNPDLVL